MELKRILNPADDTAEQRPLKRQSQSPSRLPSSPDVYELSSQPGSAPGPNMGQYFSYFDNQSSPSATPSPELGPQDLSKSNDAGNYTYQQEPVIPEESAYDPTLSGDPDSDLGGVPLNSFADLDEQLDLEHGSLPTASLVDDPPPAYDSVVPQNGPPAPPAFLTNPEIRLPDLSSSERQQYYAHLWTNNEIDLKDLAPPKLHSSYPQFADEILHAYFTHTIVKVKVWSNYDSVTGTFFWQPRNRFDDCGKLQLTPNQRRRLNTLDLEKLQMTKVRFDIGTPFRTLFEVHFWSMKTPDGEGYRLEGRAYGQRDPNGPHDDLRELTRQAMGSTTDDALLEGQVGLTLKDLDEVAKDFVLRENVAKKMGRERGRSRYFY